jgi:predicted glycosyltransferase
MPNRSSNNSEKRIVLYSHDGLGLGHTRRNLNIASAIVEANDDARCLVVSGSDDVFRFTIPDRVEVVKIPGIKKVSNNHYEGRRHFLNAAQTYQLRSDIILTVLKNFSTNIFLIDKHPLGAGKELEQSLEYLKTTNAKVFLGLRDILDAPNEVRQSWKKYDLYQSIEHYYTGIIVYGHSAICNISKDYGIHGPAEYVGYVTTTNGSVGQDNRLNSKKPLVTVSVGSGEDGEFLVKSIMKCFNRDQYEMLIIAGPQAKQNKELKLECEKAGIQFKTFVSNMPDVLNRTSVLICMGGYNTLAEAMEHAVPTICVPRTHPREEQLIRAKAFAEKGLLAFVHPDDVTPDRMHQEIFKALNQDRNALAGRIRKNLNFDGARATAKFLLEQAQMFSKVA